MPRFIFGVSNRTLNPFLAHLNGGICLFGGTRELRCALLLSSVCSILRQACVGSRHCSAAIPKALRWNQILTRRVFLGHRQYNCTTDTLMTLDRTSPRRLASRPGFQPFQVRFIARFCVLFALIVSVAAAQSALVGTCQVSTQNPQLRAEGLTEPLGTILWSCSGFGSGAVVTGNFTVTAPVSVTNKVDASGLTTQAVLSIDYGLGLTPSGVPASVSGQSISFPGVQLTAPASGSFRVAISGIRAAVNQLGASTPSVAVDLFTPLQVNTTHVTVGTPAPGLFATLADTGIACAGSPAPASPTMSSLFAAGTSLASTRVTEGFVNAFSAKAAGEDNGTRFVVTYSGFPASAQVYLPDFVAGSDAARPTLGGDLGGTATVGQYLPGSGTLLLARVIGADSNGAGGAPLSTPTGAAAVTLDSVSAVPLANGAGYAVYEVIDSNPNALENAQFPTFVGLPAGTPAAVAHESISIGPISTVATATTSDPVPRFAATTPGTDCSRVGDCQASYFPKLSVNSGPILLSAIAGGPMTSEPGYVPVSNIGGGTMIWSVAVNYVNGSGWIQLEGPTNVINGGSFRVFAQAKNLAPGSYQANLVINAGAEAGSKTVPVTLNVQAAPPPPTTPAVTITAIVNAATFAPSPLVSGSVATLQGTHLSGTVVNVTVGGLQAAILFHSDSQINFQVPPALGSQTSADVVVTVDGASSPPVTAVLAPAYPTIFAHGIRNQDWTENGTSNPARAGSVLQIFATGLPTAGTVTVQIGNQANLVPQYAAAAPTLPGVQQVNVAVPPGLAAGPTQLTLCATVNGQPYCSTNYALVVQ